MQPESASISNCWPFINKEGDVLYETFTDTAFSTSWFGDLVMELLVYVTELERQQRL